MINGKKVLAITLARGGSKAIPKKNITKINGIPLIGYTISEALASKFIDHYVVSTDDKNIADISENLGASVPFIRPPHLSTDEAKSSDALIHAIEFLEERGHTFDYIVELMATNPLKKSFHIDECINLIEEKNYDFVVAVKRVQDGHPSRLKYIEDGVLKDFYPEIPESRRQDLTPDAYIRCGSIYVMRKQMLIQTSARYGFNTGAYVMGDEFVINIDEPIDLLVAQKLLENQS